MFRHLGPAARAVPQVELDGIGFLGVHRVQGVDPQELLDLRMVQFHAIPPSVSSAVPSAVLILLSPARILLFTVPSGSPRRVATSR